MKLNELKQMDEMTMRGGSYEQLGNYIEQFNQYISADNFAGDIEKYKVYKGRRNSTTVDYVLTDNNTLIAFFQIVNGAEVFTAYVRPEYRKIGIFSMFLFFLKRNENLNQIVLGDLHSEDTIEAVKRIAKRFEVYWVNGDQKIRYDPATIDQFYSWVKPTGWKIVLENDGDFSLWPNVWEPLDLRTWYSCLLDSHS